MSAGARRRLVTALTALIAILLSACDLDASVNLAVDRDGAGQLDLRMQMDEELAANVRDADLDLFGPVEAAASESAVWDSTRTASAVTVTTTFPGPAALSERSRTLAAGLAAAELQPLEPLSVRVSDDTVEVVGQAGLDVTQAVEELGVTPEEAVDLLAESVDYTVVVEMPGEVLEASPGGRVDDRTVTWGIAAGEVTPLRALARRPPRVPVWVWAAGAAAVAVILAIGAAAVISFRRRRRPPP